jgi:WD40 repeat protein
MSAAVAFLDPGTSVALDDYVVDLAWSPNGRQIAVAGGEGRIFLVDLAAAGTEVQQLAEHTLGALVVAWQPRGVQFVSSGQDGAVRFYASDGSTGKSLRPAAVASEHLAYAPDGSRLAIASGKSLSLWSADGELQHKHDPLPSGINALSWDKPGRDLCAATHGAMVIFRPETSGQRTYKWNGTCLTVAYAPNGKVLATGLADGAVHFWYLASGKDSQMNGYPGRVTLTSWSAAGRYLATGAGSEIIVWDFNGRGPEGSKALQLSGHTDRIECLAFQPEGPYLISGGRDWRLSLWLPGKSKLAVDAHLTDSEPSALRWSPDGRYVAVGERKGKLTVFELVQGGKR